MKNQATGVRTFWLGMAVMFFSWQTAVAQDSDGDSVQDATDNCSALANPDQRDTDNDGFGNRCDPDLDNDLVVSFSDLGFLKAVFFSADEDADFDGDGVASFSDLGIMKSFFFMAPGPGATGPNVTYTSDAQPIFMEKCAPCHTVFGLGGHNIAVNYADAFLPASDSDCSGLLKGECTLVRVQSGEMPANLDCTGDPVQDAGMAGCLTQAEQDTLQMWIDGGMPE